MARGGLALVRGGDSLVAQARGLVAKLRTVDEGKAIRDQAAAIAYFARERGESIELVRDATAAKLWLERRVGQLTAEMPKATKAEAGSRGAAARGRQASIAAIPATKAQALEGAGITKAQASKWERYARTPERDFERQVREQATKIRAAAAGEKKKRRGEQAMRTPLWLFRFLESRFFRFDLDAYASVGNALCPRFITAQQDGNKTDWIDGTFANPEFEDMRKPMEQALRQAARGVRSLLVGPAPVTQVWVHELAIQGTEYRPDSRINFDNPDGTPSDHADRDTAFFLFGPGYENPLWSRGEFRVRALALPPEHEWEAWAKGEARP